MGNLTCDQCGGTNGHNEWCVSLDWKNFTYPACKHCGGPVTRGPAPIYTPSLEEHRKTFFHLADTMEEAKTLDDNHKAETNG